LGTCANALSAFCNTMDVLTRHAPDVLDWIATAFGLRRSDGAEQAPGNHIPPRAQRKWNWGACVLAPFWSFSHGLRLIGLVTLICWIAPLQPVAFVAGVLLGIFGNRLAVKNRAFESSENFIQIESSWSNWGLIALGVLVLYVLDSLWISFRSS
jgi:hypothetical protein